MRWLARWAHRMADVIDPPVRSFSRYPTDTMAEVTGEFTLGRPRDERTIIALGGPDGMGACIPCGTRHLPPLHYHTL
jgi:hypothetical protein